MKWWKIPIGITTPPAPNAPPKTHTAFLRKQGSPILSEAGLAKNALETFAFFFILPLIPLYPHPGSVEVTPEYTERSFLHALAQGIRTTICGGWETKDVFPMVGLSIPSVMMMDRNRNVSKWYFSLERSFWGSQTLIDYLIVRWPAVNSLVFNRC